MCCIHTTPSCPGPIPPPPWSERPPEHYPLPASLLGRPGRRPRLPQNADLDKMLFYGDLLKRGEIPVKDLQLSKHRVHPAAATAQSPESASPRAPHLVPLPAQPLPSCPGPCLSSDEVTREGDGLPKVTQQKQAGACRPSHHSSLEAQGARERTSLPLRLCSLGRLFAAEVL